MISVGTVTVAATSSGSGDQGDPSGSATSARVRFSPIPREETSIVSSCGMSPGEALDVDLVGDLLQDATLFCARGLADHVQRHRHLDALAHVHRGEVHVQRRPETGSRCTSTMRAVEPPEPRSMS